MFLRSVSLGFVGLCAGLFIAGSYLAFLSMIGVVPRLAAITKTAKHALFYENSIFLGGFLGSFVFIFQLQLPLGKLFLLLFGLFGGIFLGCLIGALAEMVKTLPIISRRIRLKVGIPYIIYGIAFGKMIGTWIQFFCF